MQEKEYWLAFALCDGVGPKRFIDLLAQFGSAENAWNALETEFERVAKPALTQKFFEYKKTFAIDGVLQQLDKAGAWYFTLLDEEYPQLLKESYNPPFVLYGKGEKKLLDQVHNDTFVGVVGTRKISNYGREVTQMITRDLVQAGFIIVSGLAMGVDAVAHMTTAQMKGKTIAVLGCGVDCCNPRENTRVYEAILSSGGAIVSEFPIGQSPFTGSFPSRNRIIAGLSQAIVVTEGAFDSGALITARDSFTNNRPVFAVPGPITSSLSVGPNSLLKIGGKLVTSGEDILREMGSKGEKRDKGIVIKGENVEEQKIIDVLLKEEVSFDELIKATKLSITGLSTVLSLLEMKGQVGQSETGSYYLKNK